MKTNYYHPNPIGHEFPAAKPQGNWKTHLQTLTQRVVDFFTDAEEPTISSVQDANGVVHWKGYNPATGETVHYDSIQDVLVWLESRNLR